MTTLPPIVPPIPTEHPFKRNLPVSMVTTWLREGWQDLTSQPTTSLAYGFAVYLISLVIVGGMFALGWDHILFPALAGFLVVGPVLALGLYEKSRRLENGETVSLASMISVKGRSGGQILFTGAMLGLLMLLWMRAAVIIYALFFGLRPFPGLDHIASMLLTTPVGWSMLFVGTLVGGLFAAFAFAISIFAIPMMLDKQVDALTAMGTSMRLAWNNIPVMLCWGAIVLFLFLFCLGTGLLGLIIVFPLLGHASWHVYKAVR